MRNRCYPSHLHYFIRACERAYKQQIIMKHFKLIILLILLIVINLTNLRAQNMECHGLTTVLVNNQPGEFYGIDFVVDNGFFETIGDYEPTDFIVVFKDQGGNTVPNFFPPTLFNREFMYQVTHVPTQQMCSGILKINGTLGIDPLACENDKQFAISPGQSLEMLPSDFLELSGFKEEWFILEIKDADGNVVPGNIINYELGTRNFQATVSDLSTNSCVSNFTVSSKTANNATAICDESVLFSVDNNGKATLTPFTIDDGSEGFISLTISRSEFFCDDVGKNIKVKLSAYDSQNVISQCTCKVIVQDKLPPVLEMYDDVSVAINSFEPYIIQPEILAHYYDNCGFESVQVIPNQITCNSPNPMTVKLIVKDNSGTFVSANTTISYTVPNINTELICKEEITVEVNPFSSTKIEPKLLLQGNYSCDANLQIMIAYNGIIRSSNEIKWEDEGKTFLGTVTDNDTGNTCETEIIVTKVTECSSTFVVCDTRCPDENPGNCESGYTNSDNIDWPCGFDIYVCEGASADRLSPEELETIHGVPSQNVRPQIINFDCPVIYMGYSDMEIGIVNQFSQSKKVLRTWTVLDWLDAQTYQYIQIFRVYAEGLEICDTLPWNTPIGDCTSGHTDTDAVEWPADITVNNSSVSLNALRTNPDVHPNDVEPRLVENCTSAYEITFYDVVTNIDEDTKLIERTWEIHNWVSTITSTYVQSITLNHDNLNQVCAFTFYGEPINNVSMGSGVTDASGCATLNFNPNLEYNIEPFKLGNAQDGVDIMDIILLYEAVLGFIELNPYQKISADINRDGAVTANDLIEFRKFLEGLSTWPDNLVWTFVDKNYDFPNGGLFDIPYFINTKNLIYGNEFVGIKMGDINGSYYQDGFVNSPAYTVLKAEDNSLNNGERYETIFTSDRNQNLVAVKLEYLIKDKGINITNITSELLPGFDPSKNVVITNDKIQISWGADLSVFPQGAALRNNDELFKFEYISNKNSVLSSILELNPEVHNAIKQSGSTDAATVNLYWDAKIVNGIAENPLSHLKVQPNPFYDYIQIAGLTTDANYEVSDASGRTLISGIVNADGIVDLHLLNNGFYILKISQNDRVHVTHKIIKLK